MLGAYPSLIPRQEEVGSLVFSNEKLHLNSTHSVSSLPLEFYDNAILEQFFYLVVGAP
jgi:hypothetical protein